MKKKTTKDNTADMLTAGKHVTIEAWTRAEAKAIIESLRAQAEEKGLDAAGGFIAYDYEKADLEEKPFCATLIFTQKS